MKPDDVFEWVARIAGGPKTQDVTFREYTLFRNFMLFQELFILHPETRTAQTARDAFNAGALYPIVTAREYLLWAHAGQDEFGRRLRNACFENDVSVVPEYLCYLLDTVDNPDANWRFFE